MNIEEMQKEENFEHEVLDRLKCLDPRDFDYNAVDGSYVDAVLKAKDILLTAYEKEKEKNNNVLGLIFEYGQTDGEHHKAWVIDQIVRIITENNYDKWVQHYEYDEETDEDYFWDVGIAP